MAGHFVRPFVSLFKFLADGECMAYLETTHGNPSAAKMVELLQDLDLQERNARFGLEYPERQPGIHIQLFRLLAEISDKRIELLRATTAGQPKTKLD
jgi:hypothetical protein